MTRLQTFLGDKTPAYKVFNKGANLWTRRADHIKEVEEFDKLADTERHKVMVPVSIKTRTHQCSGKSDSLPEVGESLVKILHLLAEMVQLQKESLDLFKKLAEVKK
jgi:hypothetical protein